MKKEEKKKVIYCWNCGVENNKKEKKCKSCGNDLKEKDHPVFVWLFGEIKGEIEDNIFSYICELISSFFKLHLYGTTIGVAVAFAVASSVFNLTEPEKVEVTTDEYRLPTEVVGEPTEEEIETPTEEEEQPTPKPTPKPVTPTPTPSTPSTQEKPKELYCPTGFTLRNDGKCEIVEIESAWQRHLCPDGYSMVQEGYCQKRIAKEEEYYCATTLEELKTIPSYSSPCESKAAYVKGTLDNKKCRYTYYDETNEPVAGCMDFQEFNAFSNTKPCPSGMTEEKNECVQNQDYIIEYYCLEGGGQKSELINGNQCRYTTVLDAQER